MIGKSPVIAGVWYRSFLLLLCLFFWSSCGHDALESILEQGKLRVLTRNSAHCYYLYRNTALGFEYELASEFAQQLGVTLEVKTPRWNDLMSGLDSGEGDLVAASISRTSSRDRNYDFSVPLFMIQQKVIHHHLTAAIGDVSDLSGKTIHVRKGTSYEESLRKLQNSGINLCLQTHEEIPTEEFIRRVATREIEYTVADTNIARLNQRYYPDIRLSFAIEEPQPVCWIVKKGEVELLDEINRFIIRIKAEGIFDKIYEKYYSPVQLFDYFDLKKFHQRVRTRLPKFRKTIKAYAEKHGFDWALIAAMAYQESHLNPQATSSFGAAGLMQLTARTADELGIEDPFDSTESIRGGTRYLKGLYDRVESDDERDRMMIALAGYNVGFGHVQDAMSLAEQMNLDPWQWRSLEKTLPLLRFKKYYKDARYGYCRGTEPVRYVNRIMMFYDILCMKNRNKQNDTSFSEALPR